MLPVKRTKRLDRLCNIAKTCIFLLLAYEIWDLINFHKQCHKNLKQVNRILEIMEENKKNMTRTNNSIAALMRDYTNVSIMLHLPSIFD